VGTYNTGYGATNVLNYNTKQFIYGVPAQDTAPDNPSLTGTNVLSFVSGRRSAGSGRRDIIQNNDSLGFLDFRGQTTNSATGIGSRSASIAVNAIETFSGSVRGSRISLTTVNSGTTTESSRLSLDSNYHTHRSEAHNFQNAAGSTSYLGLDTNGATFGSGSGSATIASNGSYDLVLTTNGSVESGVITAKAGVGQGVVIQAGNKSSPTSVATFNTASVTINTHILPNGDGVYDLGSASAKWRSLYVNTSTIYLGTDALSINGGTLTVNGTAVGGGATYDQGLYTTSSVTFANVALKGYTETRIVAASTTTFAPDVSTATIWAMTLTNNVTFNGFTTPVAGESATIIFTQDATGGRTLTSTMKFASGSKTLSTAGGSIDMITVFYDGTNYFASLSKGYA
jgi:hypothetical protein